MPKRKSAPAKHAAPAANNNKKSKPVLVRPQIVLAHHSGHYPAGGKHPVVQAWARALASVGNVHDGLVFPKPFNMMPRLVDTLAKAISAAAGPGHKRPVIVVGIGMGARVAVHLLSGVSGDDKKPMPDVPSSVTASVKACVCIDYPLLRVGTREVRAAPLLALPAGAAPLLFVRGTADKHMDTTKLPLKRIKPNVDMFAVEGKSATLTPNDLAAAVARIQTTCMNTSM